MCRSSARFGWVTNWFTWPDAADAFRAHCAMPFVAAMQSVVFLLAAAAARAPAAYPAAADYADQWQQWRGPLANGTAPHANPPVDWSETRNVRWKREIPGEGSASPIVWGDQVFLVSAVKTDRVVENPPQADATAKTVPPPHIYQYVVISLDRETGQQRWRRVACEDVPHEGRHSTNSFASASPVTDGERLYVSFGSRGIYCLALDGRLLWKRDLGDMRTRYGWGEGASPAVYRGSLVVNWDHEDQSFITVLDAHTGEMLWKVARDEPTSWATPLIVEHKGRPQVIVNGTNRVRSYDLASGKILWQCGGQTVNAIPSPVAAGGVVYCMSGYRGAAAVAVSLDARGDLGDGTGDGNQRPEVVWRYFRGTPYVPSPVLVDNQLYFTGRNVAIVSCLDVRTGNPVFDERRLPGLTNIYASPVAAQGRIYFVGRDGTTVVLEHGTDPQLLATNRLDEPIDASPALVGTQLFLRGSKHVYCIEEEKRKEQKQGNGDAGAAKALERAVAFLAAEVPKWHQTNRCYSCHNNGDAARALYLARQLGYHIQPEALADTTAWLGRPESWEENGGKGDFNEKDLAALQFSSALAAALRAGAINEDEPLHVAAAMVAELQRTDGSWRVNAPGSIGAPVNYGDALATASALQVLRQSGRPAWQSDIEQGERWLRAKSPRNVLTAASLLMGLAGDSDKAAVARKSTCLDLIAAGQRESGGWGPFVHAAAEPFDTALVLLALAKQDGDAKTARLIQRGRRYLAETQLPDGSWAETTRPPGAVSYAQRLSTAGWATQALLATAPNAAIRTSTSHGAQAPD